MHIASILKQAISTHFSPLAFSFAVQFDEHAHENNE